jgi:hypothetical protein
VEFRIKHGSTDTIEMANVCILYTNIINYAIELANATITKYSYDGNIYNIKQYYNNMLRIIKENGGPDVIFDLKILGSVKDYFTNPESDYVIGLQKLNASINLPASSSTKTQGTVHGGEESVIKEKIKLLPLPTALFKKNHDQKKIEIYKTGNKFLDAKIASLDDKMIFKINSFGKQFIGYGLSVDTINGLLLYLNTTNKHSVYTDEQKFEKYLKNHALSFE